MEIPRLGAVILDDQFGWYCSEPMPIHALGGRICRIVVAGYDEDPNQEDFHAAITNFLSAERDLLSEAEPYVYQYYEDMNSHWSPGDDEYVAIDRADLWKHVRLNDEPIVSRRVYRDKGVYISLECNCDWEPEHGLQIVFKEGRTVNKVGPYDGHLSHSDAFGDDRLENVVYLSM